MREFPKIKGLKRISQDCPDIVSIPVQMERVSLVDMGLPSPIELLDMYLDLSKLAGVKEWWEKDAPEASSTECVADFVGINSLVLNIGKEELLKAWLFYKTWKYATRDI